MNDFYMLMAMILNAIPEKWQTHIQEFYDVNHLANIDEFLESEYAQNQIVYPKSHEYFRALELTPLDQVKIVILGQDPYHGAGQAHGLSFSVKPDVAIPPSLRNIYKELHQDIGMESPDHGCLEDWARQGVLMLNTVLSVRHGQAASHQGIGWEALTQAMIESVNAQDRPVVFMLWGSHAQKYAPILDSDRHCILMAPHPSPLSAHRGFLGCRHFSKANEFLKKTNQDQIDWTLPPYGDDRLL